MEDNTDCDDVNALNNPMGTEVCDGVDNNCDGNVDDADSAVVFGTDDVWYAETDADGFGDANNTIDSCAQPPVMDNMDDTDIATSPLKNYGMWTWMGLEISMTPSLPSVGVYLIKTVIADAQSNPIMAEIWAMVINKADGDTHRNT